MAKPRLSSLLVFGVEWGAVDAGHSTSRPSTVSPINCSTASDRRRFKATWAIPRVEPADGGANPFVAGRAGNCTRCRLAARRATENTALHLPAGCVTAYRRHTTSESDCDRWHSHQPVACLIRSWPNWDFVRSGPVADVSHHLAQTVQPQSLRYGVWGLPVSTHWPQPNRLFQHFAQQQIAYSLRRAVQRNAVLHIVFELASMSLLGDNGASGCRSIAGNGRRHARSAPTECRSADGCGSARAT